MTVSTVVRAACAVALTALVVTTGATPRLIAQGDANQLVPANAYKDLKWRSVGATRGGRVTAYSGVRQQPHTFYFGGVGGGVWKTDDAGITWAPISDGQITSTGSIGSIDVAPSNPNHVWVGTGSAAIRSNVIIGRGVYKSTDAGAKWEFMGLKDSGQVGGIKVHPSNTNTVWLAALGSPFGPNDERGIFKTTDGGKTWKKTLFVNNETGGRDIEVDWENPDILYAAMYKGFRKGWDIISGGPATEGGIFKSTDGGETWKKISAGLPGKLIGKIDIDIARSNPRVALRDGRSARHRRRPLPLQRRRRIVGARQQQPAPARAAVLLPLRQRQPEERKRSVGERARPAEIQRRRQDLHDAWRRRTATTTACGSTPTTRTSSCRSTTAAPTSASTARRAGRRSSTSRPPSTTWSRSTSSIPIASTCRSRTTAR